MKNIIIFLLLIVSSIGFSQYPQPESAEEYKDLNNKDFFKKAWKDYVISNFSFLNEINPLPHNSCGGEGRSELKRTLKQENFTNIQFFQMNTDMFYSSQDKFQCDMKLSILMHNLPEVRRKGLVLEGKMNPDAPYWSKDIIAKRWYVAAQSLKKCGIRISEFSLTSFEGKGLEAFEYPTIDMRGGKPYNMMNSIAKDERFSDIFSTKFTYTGNVIEGNETDFRSEDTYATALTKFREDGPEVISGWIKADSLGVPIFSPGTDSDDTGYFDELHELGHIFMRKNNSIHVRFKDRPNKYGPMTERIMRSGGKFDTKDCQDMRIIGASNKLLKCYPEQQFKPSRQ